MGQQRRETGSGRVRTRKLNKKDIEVLLSEHGLTLCVTRSNVGEWNECRDFWAGNYEEAGFHLDKAMKGEKPDWNYMGEVIDKKLKLGEYT